MALGDALPTRISESAGTIHYVDKDSGGASDGGAGTSEGAPWATIAHAFATLTAGERCYVKKTATPYAESTIDLSRGGTAGNTITVEAFDPANKPIFQPRINFNNQNAKYWRLRNLIFDANSTTGTAVKITGSAGANTGANNIEFYGCEAKNTSAAAGAGFSTTQTDTHNIQFWNCLAHDCGVGSTLNHGWYLDGGSNFYMINCISYNNGGYGFQCYNEGTAGMHLSGLYFYNCLGTANERSGYVVQSNETDRTYLVQDVHFYNCIGAFNQSSGSNRYGWKYQLTNFDPDGTYTPNTMLNCLAYSNTDGDLFVASGDDAMLDPNTGFITGEDPLFVNAGTHDYNLQEGSPCIGAADVSNCPTFDFNGDTRTQADIGPFAGPVSGTPRNWVWTF